MKNKERLLSNYKQVIEKLETKIDHLYVDQSSGYEKIIKKKLFESYNDLITQYKNSFENEVVFDSKEKAFVKIQKLCEKVIILSKTDTKALEKSLKKAKTTQEKEQLLDLLFDN